METVILLVMHGVPPNDFPPNDLNEFFGLQGRLRRAEPAERDALRQRYQVLEDRMRHWPRTPQNDPFYFASRELAEVLGNTSGMEVTLAFNEFCAPEIGAAIDSLVVAGANKIVVATTMMTRGGEHSEMEINNAIRDAGERHPALQIIYAWPYEIGEVARFLTAHIRRFI